LEDGVMSTRPFLCFCAILVSTTLAWASDPTQISYTTTPLGGARWQYDYSIANENFSPAVKEVTIRFDMGQYQNLAVAEAPAGWNAIVWQPDPFLNDAGAYDALHSGAGIAMGDVVGGFSVRFDWLGTGSPASQYYEVVDPVTFATLASGWTVPEPATLGILAIGSLLLARGRTRRS
jgi:hypothetical protein